MKTLTIFILVCSVLTCKNTKDAMTSEKQKTESINGSYAISKINNDEISNNKLEISFDLQSKTVSGFSGCNRFTGSFETTGNSITFGPLASTRMACRPEKNDIENKMLQALSTVNNFTIENGVLSLKQDKNIVLNANKNNSTLKDYTITYNAVTRGTYLNYSIENGSINIQNQHNQKPTQKDISSQDALELSTFLEQIDLNTLNSLEPPSKAHQYDGALGATLTVNHNGNTYRTPTFDHGKPPKSIERIVNKVLSMAKMAKKP